jgi:RNA polymerase-binding transcription factor DksA
MTTFSVETLAAPHLSDESLAFLRSVLLRQLAEHTELAEQYRATADELTGRADTSSLLEREIAEVASTHFTADVRETRYALRRLDDGMYGICARCGDPIPFERLEAIPHARRCVRCPDEPAGLIG